MLRDLPMSPRQRAVSLTIALASSCSGADQPAPCDGRSDAVTASMAGEPSAPAAWSDAWILDEGTRFRKDTGYRRAVLERSLVNPTNLYSRQRLASYGLGSAGWDKLPVWNPRSRPVDREAAARLARGDVPDPPSQLLWDGVEPTTMSGWVALGQRVFLEYPMRAEVFMEWGLTRPAVAAAVGVDRPGDGSVPGLVVFADVDGQARVGITCAICHADVRNGAMVAGAARRRFDYGRLRLAYYDDTGGAVAPALARRMAHWGPGRADVTEDDDEDPVAIPDLWGLRAQRFLTQTGAIRHDTPVALAIRQETQLIDSNHAMVRPPRALSWALTTYVYSLMPPPRPAGVSSDGRPTSEGAALFSQHCAGCHANAAYGGATLPALDIATDPALARGRGRGTGSYRVPTLLGVEGGAPYLHDGTVGSLRELLSPARLEPDYAGGRFGPGPIPGHRAGTDLTEAERATLIDHLGTL